MIIIIGYIMIAVGLMISAFFIFMLHRNEWVYEERMRILYHSGTDSMECLVNYGKLVEYNEMLWKFWVWDVKKFEKK